MNPTTSSDSLANFSLIDSLSSTLQHGVLAVDGGHDGNAEIDQPVLVAHAETPVLRHALLGDIQLATSP